MQNKYKEGDTVFALDRPGVVLVIRRYLSEIYYCKIQNDPDHKDVVYFERELAGPAPAQNKTQ